MMLRVREKQFHIVNYPEYLLDWNCNSQKCYTRKDHPLWSVNQNKQISCCILYLKRVAYLYIG